MKKKEQHIPNEPDGDLSHFLHPGVKEVFRDDDIWVLDKPAGVLSHPNQPGKASNALFRAPYDADRELYRVRLRASETRPVHLIHRLDMDTSGLILCCFGPEAASCLKESLYRREVEKEYRALLVGSIKKDGGEWSDCLRKVNRGGRVEVRAERRGRPNAFTEYRVLKRFPRSGLLLVALMPKSGRTHQLRVQAASRNLPVAGDERYGDFTANRCLAQRIGLKHMFLHAWRLEFRHPANGHLLKLKHDFSRRLSDPLERLKDLGERVPRKPPPPTRRAAAPKNRRRRGGS